MDGKQRKRLVDALRAAYDEDSLAQLVRFQLELTLTDLVRPANFANGVISPHSGNGGSGNRRMWRPARGSP